MSVIISVIIPCFNEEAFIKKCLLSLVNQKNIPGDFEIIVADGKSTDSTRSIIQKLSLQYSNIRMIDNPKRITPSAFNIGIKNSSGKYVCIMGAHSEYDENYLSNCLKLFEQHPEVSCVGGPIKSQGKNNFAKAAAIAMSSRVGVGNAKHRFPEYEGYAEMACFPMFKREVFNEIGFYDESLVRNQDDEFCFRLRLNGGKIYISPTVVSEYYVRDSPSKLFNQYFNYGKWRIAVLKKHKLPIALRQFVPVLFFSLILLLIIQSILLQTPVTGVILPVVYILTIVIFSVKVLFKYNLSIALNFILAVPVLHVSYAAGFIAGILQPGNKYERNRK